MIAFPAGVRVWIAGGVTDMRRGMNTLALTVQQGLGRDPHAGEIFCFRGRKGELVKLLWHDGFPGARPAALEPESSNRTLSSRLTAADAGWLRSSSRMRASISRTVRLLVTLSSPLTAMLPPSNINLRQRYNRLGATPLRRATAEMLS